MENDPDYQKDLPLQEKSLIDPSWELVDPTPNLYQLYVQLDKQFFWNKIYSARKVEVRWSLRMTKSAAIFSKIKPYKEGQGGQCDLAISEPLFKYLSRKDLVETLLHEMIHAFLFVTSVYETDKHGPEYHKHMNRINEEAGTNITVRHYYPDAVEFYKERWWMCDGPCRDRPPYYGELRCSMREIDWWIKNHQQISECGGTFHKVEEPEKKKKKLDKNNNELNTTNTINSPTETKPADSNAPSGKEQIQTAFSGSDSKLRSSTDSIETPNNAVANHLANRFSDPGPSTEIIKQSKNETEIVNQNSTTDTEPTTKSGFSNKSKRKMNEQRDGGTFIRVEEVENKKRKYTLHQQDTKQNTKSLDFETEINKKSENKTEIVNKNVETDLAACIESMRNQLECIEKLLVEYVNSSIENSKDTSKNDNKLCKSCKMKLDSD